MSDFLDIIRTQLTERIAERNAAKSEMDAVLAAPSAEKRDLNDTEATKFNEVRTRLAVLDQTDPTAERFADSIKSLELRAAELEAIEARQYEAAKLHRGAAKVGTEARTYSKDAERRDGISFLADVAAVHNSGLFVPGAQERVARHMQEERIERGGAIEARAVGTSAFGALTVPQYLVDLYAPYARAGRPLADICNHHDLPNQGMTVEISRITTGSTVALQASQGDAASETNMDDTALSIPVRTAAGQQTVSRQALERGSGIESVVMGDLFSAYHTTLDSTLIVTATTGLNAVTDANVDVAYTDASPTAAELWPKLFDCVQQVQTAVKGQAQVNAMLMHPRRFWWLASNVGTNFPFVNLAGAGPQSGGKVDTTQYGAGPSGYLAGLPVHVDANIATDLGGGTEDAIYVLARSECHLWEDPNAPLFIRAEQTAAATLGVLFVVYGYFAYTFSRFASANGRIAGTGLAAPTF